MSPMCARSSAERRSAGGVNVGETTLIRLRG